MKAINDDIINTVFLLYSKYRRNFILWMVETVERILNKRKAQKLLRKTELNGGDIQNHFISTPRIEKIAIKDVKLRTFITQDSQEMILVAHVYDSTYGVVKPTDNLVIIDDSIVRGTTLKKSILKILGPSESKDKLLLFLLPRKFVIQIVMD